MEGENTLGLISDFRGPLEDGEVTRDGSQWEKSSEGGRRPSRPEEPPKVL